MALAYPRKLRLRPIRLPGCLQYDRHREVRTSLRQATIAAWQSQTGKIQAALTGRCPPIRSLQFWRRAVVRKTYGALTVVVERESTAPAKWLASTLAACGLPRPRRMERPERQGAPMIWGGLVATPKSEHPAPRREHRRAWRRQLNPHSVSACPIPAVVRLEVPGHHRPAAPQSRACPLGSL